MQSQELKELVELGLYKPNPAEIADAMLRRRGVRELLSGGLSLSEAPAGQSQSARQVPRQAA